MRRPISLSAVLFAAFAISQTFAFVPSSSIINKALLPSHHDVSILTLSQVPKRFKIVQSNTLRPLKMQQQHSMMALSASSESGGDQLRASTGIRPSLHPTTINAISEALLLRHSIKDDKPIDIWKSNVQPIEVAMTAGALAADLLDKRKASCEADGDTDSIPTEEECQTVAGRVVGVVMRMRQLEVELAKRVNTAAWVNKYGEHGSFGVLKKECKAVTEDAPTATVEDVVVDEKLERDLTDKIRDDPLFRMCRAECLLAIFLQTVEVPTLLEVGQEVPGGSVVDFIDEDRREVILS